MQVLEDSGFDDLTRLTQPGIIFGSSFQSWVVCMAKVEFFVPNPGVCAHLFLDLHKPSPKVAQKLGYPLPLIDHSKARDRALRRYKNPGAE